MNLILPRRRLQKHLPNNLVRISNNGECPLAYLTGTNHTKLVRAMTNYYRNTHPLNMSKQTANNLIQMWEMNATCPTNYMRNLTPEQTYEMWSKVLEVYHRSNPVNNRSLHKIRMNMKSPELKKLLAKKKTIKKSANNLKVGVLRNKQLPNYVMIPAINKNTTRRISTLKQKQPRYSKYI